MSKVERRGRGRPPVLSHILPPDVHHRQVRLGMVLSLTELERLAALSCSEQGIGDPTNVDFYFTGKEIVEAIRAVMPHLEVFAGFWNVLEKASVPDQDSFDKAMHDGLYSARTYRSLNKEADKHGRRLPNYKSLDEIYGPDNEMTKTDQQKVQATKYQLRRKLRNKIATSLKEFLGASPESPLRALVRILLAAEERHLRMLTSSSPNQDYLAAVARDMAKLDAEVRRAVNELNDRGQGINKGQFYFSLG